MKYINSNGITSSTSTICRNVCEKNNWYVDMLVDGKWLVSKQDTAIGLFSDLEEAIFFFMAKSEPIEPLSQQEEDEAMEWLEEQLR
jgi:hypothetical protein